MLDIGLRYYENSIAPKPAIAGTGAIITIIICEIYLSSGYNREYSYKYSGSGLKYVSLGNSLIKYILI